MVHQFNCLHIASPYSLSWPLPIIFPSVVHRITYTQDTIVAIRKGGSKLTVTSLLPDKYPDMHFDTDPKQVGWSDMFGMVCRKLGSLGD